MTNGSETMCPTQMPNAGGVTKDPFRTHLVGSEARSRGSTRDPGPVRALNVFLVLLVFFFQGLGFVFGRGFGRGVGL